MRIYHYISLLASLLVLNSCEPNKAVYQKNPLDDLVKKMTEVPNFSIILFDMNYDESSKKYLHQYTIIKEDAFLDTMVSETTEWLQVSDTYFNSNVENMGMALVSKSDGKVEKKVSPPGYNNYVGNEKYGNWNQGSNGNSFWEFYGKYAMLRSVMGFGMSPIYRGGWNDYRRNYYPTNRTYYGQGSNGGTRFGTTGSQTSNRSTRSTWNSKPSSFKQNVRSKVQRSSSRTSSRSSRSSSRYRSSSSSRGRGFGGGK
jgi:hypothetical protein